MCICGGDCGCIYVYETIYVSVAIYICNIIILYVTVLAWRIPGTGEPGGLPSLGSHRVGHDWSDLAAACNM